MPSEISTLRLVIQFYGRVVKEQSRMVVSVLKGRAVLNVSAFLSICAESHIRPLRARIYLGKCTIRGHVLMRLQLPVEWLLPFLQTILEASIRRV